VPKISLTTGEIVSQNITEEQQQRTDINFGYKNEKDSKSLLASKSAIWLNDAKTVLKHPLMGILTHTE